MKRAAIALVLAIGAAFGLVGGVAGSTLQAESAQAFNHFTYVADCPGTATGQRLRVTNNSGGLITYDVYPNYPFGKFYGSGYVYNNQTGYFPSSSTWIGFDKVGYYFKGAGNLNWTYSVSCTY